MSEEIELSQEFKDWLISNIKFNPYSSEGFVYMNTAKNVYRHLSPTISKLQEELNKRDEEIATLKDIISMVADYSDSLPSKVNQLLNKHK